MPVSALQPIHRYDNKPDALSGLFCIIMMAEWTNVILIDRAFSWPGALKLPEKNNLSRMIRIMQAKYSARRFDDLRLRHLFHLLS